MTPRPLILAAALALMLSPACVMAGRDRYQQQLAELATLAARDGADGAPARSATQDDSELFAGAAELTRPSLVAAVLANNPSLDVARQAWRAALAEFPQRTALADPMASYGFAPLSVVGDVPFGQQVMISQAFPFPGKRELRGAAALAEAEAMRGDLEETRLALAMMASMLHAEYFENARALEINDEHRALLLAMRAALQARFEAGDESLQGPLGAELVLADVERDRVRVLAARDVLLARINQLLHRAPNALLPPAPAQLPAAELADATPQALLKEAVERRPELSAVRARIKGADAEIAMAKAESWPDFSLNTAYNSMSADLPHQFMIGGTIDIPIQLERRAAAVEQAEARRRRTDAELLVALDAVRTEVETERLRVLEARAVLDSYDGRTLPLARAVVDAAQAGVQTNRTSFLELLEAERALRQAKLERAAAAAALQAQVARLERALGRTPIANHSSQETAPPGVAP